MFTLAGVTIPSIGDVMVSCELGNAPFNKEQVSSMSSMGSI